MPISERFKNAWNAFTNRDPTEDTFSYETVSSTRPDRPQFTRGNEKTIVSSIYNRISIDVSSIDIRHVRLDNSGRYLEDMDSDLNECLTLSSNLDQTSRAFLQDVVISLLDEGCVAIAPIDTKYNPNETNSYDIQSLRVGKIIEWRPSHVKVRAYNERTGHYEDLLMEKRIVAIIENPLYSVMNEPNSTLKRLVHKLNLLDSVDEQTSSGKLDLIIQLPYSIKSEGRRKQAESRRKDIERQLTNTKYGIAYTDATEKIIQLNRSLENNLLKQVEYLTAQLYSQLGLTDSIMDGTADEQTMLNYFNRTVEPILSAIVDEMKRKFLTKTARTQRQSIIYFRNPFRLVPVGQIAEIADKFTRNEIMTSNEIRQVIAMKPSKDPNADSLRNSNISQSKEIQQFDVNGNPINTDLNSEDEEISQNNKT